MLVEAPPASVEWTAYPVAPAPPAPSLEPVAVTVEAQVTPAPAPQPVCDEHCQAANTLGFVLPALFEVMIHAPVIAAPAPPPSRVVKAVPLGTNR